MKTLGQISAVLHLFVATNVWSQERVELSRIQDEVAALGVRIDSLAKEYETPRALASKSPSARMMDGEILYLLGDYQRASVVLLQLVEQPGDLSKTAREKTSYYLAESLYQIGNNISARSNFENLVRSGGEYAEQSMRRLIQISDRLQQWEGLRERIEELLQRGPLPPDIAYIYARSLLLQEAPQRALEMAQQVPQSHRLFSKSRYLAAVAQLTLGNLEGAHQIFAALNQDFTAEEGFEDTATVRDLAALGAGRILMEQRRLTESMDAYQAITHTSPMFEEALYEVTWTFVQAAAAAESDQMRDKEYRRALNALEILLLSENQTTLAPEARLLLGNIFLRLRDFEGALETFDAVVSLYRPLRDELRRLSNEIDDPAAYFDEVAERTKEGKSVLPPLAVKWASGEKRLRKAMGVVEDLERSEGWIQDAERSVDKLMAVLDSENRAAFFPNLQDAKNRFLALRNTLLAVDQRLLAVERDTLRPYLTAEQARQLEEVLAERARLEPGFRALPQDKEDFDGRVERLRATLMELKRTAYQLRYPIKAMRNEVLAMRRWLADNEQALSPSERDAFVERLDQQDAEVRELEIWQDKLEEEVARESSLIALKANEQTADRELRERYHATLDREQKILAAATGQVSGKPLALLREIAQTRETVASHNTALDRFRSTFDAVVATQSEAVAQKVLQEQARLADYRAAIDQARSHARFVVGGIAAASLDEVRAKFHNIVLRADVGLVDVAWQLKEQQTHEISRRVNEQSRELQLLDAEFAEVLED